jgi:hypothetical protein
LVRSALKALGWRLFSTCVTVCLALLLLPGAVRPEDALRLGGAEFVAKFAMYVAYERLWAALPALLRQH